jgi:ADP-ribose pyrophosphatase YjhB (NUDIX family)
MADFNKVGLLVIKDNSFLVCRKNDYTSKLIMPGGQIESGESVQECLEREIHEELGNDVSLEHVEYFGTYQDRAAADDPTIHKTVEIKLYSADLKGIPTPSSEVVELIWFNPRMNQADLSAIITNKILPDLIARGVLKQN